MKSHLKKYKRVSKKLSKKSKQLQFAFAHVNQKNLKTFGGEILVGKRKTARPLSDKKPIHLVLRSNSVKVFTPTNKSLKRLIYGLAEKYSIKIYELALNHNHIHFVIKLRDKQLYKFFISELTSKMALAIRKKLPHLKTILSLRPWTRILEWGKDFGTAINYVILNIEESMGWIVRGKAIKKSEAGQFAIRSQTTTRLERINIACRV